ncbi:uncharacterized protein LOC131048376 [Cryptomeria japonica]|uniref:uncharacterized protein LOC131048376 n=1 Tax=Cryptomeria japonica TaxID=3369 RepID=UPI0027D9EA3B|nr:uncharacterized protein LOC131048376 [Cryptomeria japonica]
MTVSSGEGWQGHREEVVGPGRPTGASDQGAGRGRGLAGPRSDSGGKACDLLGSPTGGDGDIGGEGGQGGDDEDDDPEEGGEDKQGEQEEEEEDEEEREEEEEVPHHFGDDTIALDPPIVLAKGEGDDLRKPVSSLRQSSSTTPPNVVQRHYEHGEGNGSRSEMAMTHDPHWQEGDPSKGLLFY